MTTIIPDTSTEEGQKLLQYQPGDTVAAEFKVGQVSGNKMMVEVTKCEPAEQEEAGEGEGEGEPGGEGGPPMGGMMNEMGTRKGVPGPVVIAIGHARK